MNQHTEISPLGFRHPLQHREPAAGFASRLAALNARPMRSLLYDMRIDVRGIDKGDEHHVRKLAQLGGADPEALIRYTPQPLPDGERSQMVAGERLGHLGINRTYFRFCPHCVSEDLQNFEGPMIARPWLRLEWTISAVRTCPKHDVYLDASQPIRRRYEAFDFAETMGTLLPEIERMAGETQPAPPSPFRDWVVNRIDGKRSSDQWLDQFPLYVGTQWCEALGLSALHPPKVKTAELSQAEWARAADEGFRISSQGREGVETLLAELNEREQDTRGFWGPRDTYG